MVNIDPIGTSWPNPLQYAQAIIDDESAGTHFVLKAGVHRMQNIELRTNDTLEFEIGAILRGSQDISGLTWTQDGTTWWASIADITTVNGSFLTGYAPWRQWPIIDGIGRPFMSDLNDVDETSCHYNSGTDRLYIGVSPAGKTIELARTYVAIEGAASNTTGVMIYGDRALPAVIENYASGAQSTNAGLKIGRDSGGNIPNANWTFQDIEIRNFRGMALAHGSDCLLRRFSIHHTGQLGLGGSASSDTVVELAAVYFNGFGGWSSGWEAGNTKWARVHRGHYRSSFYDTVDIKDPTNTEFAKHLATTGSMWFDIDNDGCEIYRNQVLDRGHEGSRGLFWEISYSAKIYHNIVYQCGWRQDPDGLSYWGNGIIPSLSGAKPPLTEFDWLDIYDNHLYDNGGGIHPVQNGERGWTTPPLYGEPWLVDFTRTWGNVTQIKRTLFSGGLSWYGRTGPGGSFPDDTPWATQMEYDRNLYSVNTPDNDHWWYASQVGGAGGYSWSEWQADGFDINGILVPSSDEPRHDYDPFNGGAM